MYKARVVEAYGRLPLSFEANCGQAKADTRFFSRGAGYSLLLKSSEAELSVGSGATVTSVVMKFLNVNPSPRIEGIEEQSGKSNYLIGDDPSKWQTGVANYAKVRYAAVYPGIDMIFYGNQRQLEYDFVVSPGADPRAIRLEFAGAKRPRVDAAGDLVLTTAAGGLRQRKPIVYQETNGRRQVVEGRYVIDRRNQVSFAVGDYDASQPLVIDPVIAYSTFLGGSGMEFVKGIAVDAAGNAYVAGYTASLDFLTTPGAMRTMRANAANVFITKLNAAGTAFVYSTYLGGHHGLCCIVINTDGGRGVDVAVDAAGSAYVTGYTTARDFPVTPGAAQPMHDSNCAPGTPDFNCFDGFVTKLNAGGNALVYSTFLGGNRFDAGTGIALDAAGAAYVSGTTSSPNFPATPGAAQAPGNGAFAAKLNPAGTALVYSTGLGGQIAYAIAVDAGGNAYATGIGGGGIIVTKLNAAGTEVVYGRRLDGDSFDLAFDIAVDAMGSAYVTGYTWSRNFPVTPTAFQTTHGGGDQDVFVTKLNPAGTALVYSTYLGGSRGDGGYGIAVDANGHAAVTGQSFSPNFPLTSDALQPPGGGSGVFVTRLDATGTAIDYSTFLGSNSGIGYGLAADARGDLYVTGEIFSGNFPVSPDAAQRLNRGGGDLFLTKLSGFSAPSPTTVTSVSTASFTPAVARGSIVAAFGPGLASVTREAGVMPLPTALGGVMIKVRDGAGVERLAPLFFVSPNQINYLMPAETSEGTAKIAVERSGADITTELVPVAAVAPGLFAANANGRGVAAAVALRLSATGFVTNEPVARFDPQQGRHIAVPLDLGPEGDQVFLQLFGTGIRNRGALAGVSARIGGTAAEILYAGLQPMFAGLDQVNVRLPRTLAGRGEVDLVLTVDGKLANAVQVNLK
ncbi:MAG: SBBP repeat-containing protein [Blastocatellia bacterium]